MTVLAALLGAALGAIPVAATTAPAVAQAPAAPAPDPSASQAVRPAEARPDRPRSGALERDPEVEAIGKELRCPVCQGMPIGESPSETAQAMMKRVRELHAEGKSPEEIRQYFVQRYGQWVLLEPEAQGFNLLVWVLPPVALLAGVAAVLLYVRRGRKQPAAPAPTPAAPPSDDPYLRRVRERIEKGDA